MTTGASKYSFARVQVTDGLCLWSTNKWNNRDAWLDKWSHSHSQRRTVVFFRILLNIGIETISTLGKSFITIQLKSVSLCLVNFDAMRHGWGHRFNLYSFTLHDLISDIDILVRVFDYPQLNIYLNKWKWIGGFYRLHGFFPCWHDKTLISLNVSTFVISVILRLPAVSVQICSSYFSKLWTAA